MLRYPDLVAEILSAVVNAVDVPVTLQDPYRMVTWDERNCVEIAKLAEDCGIAALTIHGRTRASVCSKVKLNTTVFGQ